MVVCDCAAAFDTDCSGSRAEPVIPAAIPLLAPSTDVAISSSREVAASSLSHVRNAPCHGDIQTSLPEL